MTSTNERDHENAKGNASLHKLGVVKYVIVVVVVCLAASCEK